MIDSEMLRSKAKSILKKEGKLKESNENFLKNFILPGLEASKNILETIYFKPPKRFGLMGKIKTFVQEKIIFTTINVIEKPSMRQQKFNNLTFKAIEEITKEIENLKSDLEKLKSKTKN
ncbi:MAG: hypothetical protein KatS3mg085_077 [Candidatus Dojkabacteria bacterium]|nr:MAG: hypothetical protein KatS3mg085_077 [Candidatus Dojkabacteria bacterium]